MAIITISATLLGNEIISGVPQLVSLYTNIPATLYYTLDGSVPTINASVYTDIIEMPVDSSVRLRALALSGGDSGTLDLTFATDNMEILTHRSGTEGIVVDAYGITPVLYDGYTTSPENIVNVPTRYSDYELVDLDLKYSRTGPNGEGPGTLITMGPIPASQYEKAEEIDEHASSPNNQNVYFNPKSVYITIDGRDGYADQVVRIINRPYDGSLNIAKYQQGRLLKELDLPITGGHVRSFYNAQTGTYVSYYFDTFELRWIKSVQYVNPNDLPKNLGLRAAPGPAVVIQWIYNKRSAI